jgi:hypothetical protein
VLLARSIPERGSSRTGPPDKSKAFPFREAREGRAVDPIRWGWQFSGSQALDEAYVPFLGAAWDDAMVGGWSANPLGMMWPEMDAAIVVSGGGGDPPPVARRPVVIIAAVDVPRGLNGRHQCMGAHRLEPDHPRWRWQRHRSARRALGRDQVLPPEPGGLSLHCRVRARPQEGVPVGRKLPHRGNPFIRW